MRKGKAKGEVATVVRSPFEGDNEVNEVVGGRRGGMVAVPFEESSDGAIDCFEWWHDGGGGGGGVSRRERTHLV